MDFNRGSSQFKDESESGNEFEFDPVKGQFVPKKSAPTQQVKTENDEDEEMEFNPSTSRLERPKVEDIGEKLRETNSAATSYGFDKDTAKLKVGGNNESESKGKKKNGTKAKPVEVDIRKRGTGGYF